MKPAGVHHVAICVADAQKGLSFYRDVLGMTQLPRPDLGRGYWLYAGGQQVHLKESDTQPLAANHFAIRVDDIDAAVTDLQEQGVEVHRIPFIPGAGHQPTASTRFGFLTTSTHCSRVRCGSRSIAVQPSLCQPSMRIWSR